MKKLVIIIIIMVTTVGAGGFVEGGYMDKKTIKEFINIKGISQIDADFTIGRITIYESNDEEIAISGSISGNSSRGVEVNRNGDILYIKQKVGYFPIRIGITEILIGIPANYEKNLNIYQRTGKLTVKEINVENLNLKSLASSTFIDDVLFKNLYLKVGSGSSTIDLRRSSGNMTIDSSVGKVNVAIKKVAGDIRFEGGTMGGTLRIPENAPVEITNIGNNKCQVSAKTSQKKIFNIILKPGVGKIKVTNNEDLFGP